jgi:FkbM family methyltransferase
MHWLEQHLQHTSPPDTIIHLGAGWCSELPLWKQTGAGRIVLVEPNPEILPDLQALTRDHDNIEVVAAAVTDRDGRGSLLLFNFPMLNSLRTPTSLYRSLPGLQQVGQTLVELVSSSTLLDQLNLEPELENWLVLDTPGEEAAIVEGLEQSGRLHDFTRLFVSAGCEACYQDAQSASQIVDRLSSLDYHRIGSPDHSDADWPRYHLHLDRKAIECRRLEIELAEHKKRDAEHKADLLATADALDSMKQLLARTELDCQARLEAAGKELDAALAELDQHKDDLARLDRAHNEIQQENSKLQAELQTHKHLAAESDRHHQARILELEGALDEQRTKFDQLGCELDSARKETIQLKEERDHFKTDLSLALRLQMLRESDLKELQSRYKEVLTIKDEQQDLLTQLHHRLSRAADFLQLVQSRPGDQGLPTELLEALTGKDDQRG